MVCPSFNNIIVDRLDVVQVKFYNILKIFTLLAILVSIEKLVLDILEQLRTSTIAIKIDIFII